MTSEKIFHEIRKKSSFLCVGLDTDGALISGLLKTKRDAVFVYNKAIADATAELCVAFKINTAFYEAAGSDGWKSLEKTIEYLKSKYPNHFTIADAKRSDIGNTAKQYAKAFFEKMDFDAITVNPYMGEDSVTPFLGYSGKWVILIALTSNKGAEDFQVHSGQKSGNEKFLFEKVLEKSKKWGTPENMMYVVGATRSDMLRTVRAIVPEHFLLVPGIGAQGGNMEEVIRAGINKQYGLLINVSRQILYAGNSTNFAEKARIEAGRIKRQMEDLLKKRR